MVADAREAQKKRLLAARPDAETLAGVLMASYLGAALHFTTTPQDKGLMDILTPLVDANLTALAVTATSKSTSKKVSR